MTTAAIDLPDRPITGDELLAVGDIGPCELIDGRIVLRSPADAEHGFIETTLARELGNYVKEGMLGWVLVGEVGFHTRRSPDRVRGADVVFISRARLPSRPGKKFLEVAPELIVEILSPDDRWENLEGFVLPVASLFAK